jgi:hypothetical protein
VRRKQHSFCKTTIRKEEFDQYARELTIKEDHYPLLPSISTLFGHSLGTFFRLEGICFSSHLENYGIIPLGESAKARKEFHSHLYCKDIIRQSWSTLPFTPSYQFCGGGE